MMASELWLIVWDDSTDDDLARAERAVAVFQRRTGLEPEVIGVPSLFDCQAEAALKARGLEVRHNLHAWQKYEIWVGAEE